MLARGDATAGALLLVLAERGVTQRLLERGMTPDGGYAWVTAGPKTLDRPGELADYITRRRRSDPDLWVVELDGDAASLAALTAESASGEE